MTTVANATATATTTTATAAAGGLAAPEGAEDRFLKLLVAQMRNQDPLNPLDNAEVTSQMAQISTVNGIEKLNASIAAMASGFTDTQSLQAAALIGRDVLVEGSALVLGADGAGSASASARGGFALAGDADRVMLEVRDLAGALVQRVDLGAQPAGQHSFTWDGANDAGAAMAPGRYAFSVTATRGSAAVESTPLSAARVLSITRGADGLALELDGLGPRAYGDIRQIL